MKVSIDLTYDSHNSDPKQLELEMQPGSAIIGLTLEDAPRTVNVRFDELRAAILMFSQMESTDGNP